MEKNKLSKKILVGIIILILCFFAFLFFIFNDIKNRSEDIVKLEDELSHQEEKNQYLLSMEKMVKNADNSISQINSSILESTNDIQIIEKIENIAEKNGLEINIDSISIEEIAAISQNEMTSLKIKAKTTGPWKGTYNFITELEALEQKVRIEKLILNTVVVSVEGEGDISRTEWQTILEIRLLKYK